MDSTVNVSLIHHVNFLVSNANQAAFWYSCCMGFERFAECRKKTTLSIALRNGKAILLITSPTSPVVVELNAEIAKHGDFVKDIAFQVDNMDLIIQTLKCKDLKILDEPKVIRDTDGAIRLCRIQGSAGSIVHTLIEQMPEEAYNGVFLPGFVRIPPIEFCSLQSVIPVLSIDHVVENHEEGTLDTITDWYNEVFRMHRFWSVDEKVVHTEYSALKAYLVANKKENVQITLAEPVPTTKRKTGQLQEFLDFHTSPGIQHIAFTVDNIVEVVAAMKKRSVEFLSFPSTYYANLRERLQTTNLQIHEELDEIESHGILMDFDEGGYLLQIFTKPMQSRPTFFIEIIQRHNFKGFGAGNFKALFEAVELEQKKRGTLDVPLENGKSY
ncbi:putative protein C31H2.4 [Aphelenchoides besseyi]|nr:putative protein C31H2.4 [Aphelenchoides besseyi]